MRRNRRPEISSCATRQTGTGRSPGSATNSKSIATASRNAGMTSRAALQLEDHGMIGLVDDAVTECEPHHVAKLHLRPRRLAHVDDSFDAAPVRLLVHQSNPGGGGDLGDAARGDEPIVVATVNGETDWPQSHDTVA